MIPPPAGGGASSMRLQDPPHDRHTSAPPRPASPRPLFTTPASSPPRGGAPLGGGMNGYRYDFEKPIAELEHRLQEARKTGERDRRSELVKTLEVQLEQLKR